MVNPGEGSLTVEYGGLYFYSRPVEGREPFAIVKDGLRGWWGRPSSRVSEVDSLAGHGGPLLPTTIGPRQVSLTARLLERESRSARSWLDSLSNLPLEGRLRVKEDEVHRWSLAQLIDVPASREHLNALGEFQLIWRCPDPRKYGEEREFVSTGGGVSAFQYGGADAWPTFEVTGFPNGYRIEGLGPNDGRFYTVSEKPGSATDLIDFKTGMITRNGVPVSRVTTQRHVWPVAPNGETPWRVRPLSSGSGSARMRVLDTWM